MASLFLFIMVACQLHVVISFHLLLPLQAKKLKLATRVSATATPEPSLTQRILESIPQESQAGGAGGAVEAPNTWEALQRAEQLWSSLKDSNTGGTPLTFVQTHPNDGAPPAGNYEGETLDYDVVVCGGTLGIFVAAALAVKEPSLRIAVLEQAPALRGRAQEWNLSLKELQDLVKLGVFSEEDIDGAVELSRGEEIRRSPDPETLIATHFKAVRAGFNSAETVKDSDGSAPAAAYGRKIKTDSPGTRAGNSGEELSVGMGKQELWIDGILNLGVRPDVAIQKARKTFEAVNEQPGGSGGNRVFAGTKLAGVGVHAECAALATDKGTFRARLVVDAMGHGSPIVRQVRAGQKPDGVCVVVGTCARGFGEASPQADALRPQARLNNKGDLIYTNEDMRGGGEASSSGGGGGGIGGSTEGSGKGAAAAVTPSAALQYFWEAFPAGASEDMRTTYLFTYLDAEKGRPGLVDTFEDYWERLRVYQGIEPDPRVLPGFDPQRALFAFFPTYRRSPLPSTFDRILHAGDASGIQSPLSFGGFGALTRHLDRISTAVVDALVPTPSGDSESRAGGDVVARGGDAGDDLLLSKAHLSMINPYMPGLSATWMFQRAMSARPPPERTPPPDFVNRLLRTNFDIMNDLGEQVSRPFLQDVVQFRGLALTLLEATRRDPLFIPQILVHVGPAALLEWLGHFATLAGYTALHHALGRHILEAASASSSSSSSSELRSSSESPTSVGSPTESSPVGQWLSSLSPVERFTWLRRAEAWEYGAGLDYEL